MACHPVAWCCLDRPSSRGGLPTHLRRSLSPPSRRTVPNTSRSSAPYAVTSRESANQMRQPRSGIFEVARILYASTTSAARSSSCASTTATRSTDRAESRRASHLVSTWYDRRRDRDAAVAAPHQEDLLQAMTYPPFKKSRAEGGPSVKNVAALLASPGPAPRMCRHRVFAHDGAPRRRRPADLAWSQGDSNP